MTIRGKGRDDQEATPVETLTGHVDDWEEIAVDYVDERLDPRTKALVDQHLSGCSECATRLRIQQAMAPFLRQTPLEEPPAEMEDAVLGELLFSPSPDRYAAPPAAETPSRLSGISSWWRRSFVPWVPATVALVALLVGLSVFGVLRGGGGPAEQAALTTAAAVETTAAAPNDQVATMEAAADTAGSHTAGTEPPGTTEAALGAAGIGAEETEVAMSTPKAISPAVQDRQGMIDGLNAAVGAPAFVVFAGPVAASAGGESDATDTTTTTAAPAATSSTITTAAAPPSTAVPSGDTAPAALDEPGLLSAEQVQAAAHQIEALTGLQPLGEDGAFGTPVFAAYLPLEDVEQFVDLLRDIGISIDLSVGLVSEPDAGLTDVVTALLSQYGSELVELSAHRTPAPSVSAWSFTTSTLAPPADDGATDSTQIRDTEPVTPVEAGTHVLVVILMSALTQ